MELYFRQFIELTERPPSYLDALQDELGIDPKTMEKNPQWAANVSLGNVSFNGMMYKITNFVRKGGAVTGAMIKPMAVQGVKSQRAYINRDGNQIRSPESAPDGKEQFIPIDKLNALMSQGFSSAPAGGAGSADGALPGGMPI